MIGHISRIGEWRAEDKPMPSWQRITSAIGRYILIKEDGIVIKRDTPDYYKTRLKSHGYIMKRLNCTREDADRVLDGTYDLTTNEIMKLVGMEGFQEIMDSLKKKENKTYYESYNGIGGVRVSSRGVRFPIDTVNKNGERIHIEKSSYEGKTIYSLNVDNGHFNYSTSDFGDCLSYARLSIDDVKSV